MLVYLNFISVKGGIFYFRMQVTGFLFSFRLSKRYPFSATVEAILSFR